MTLVEFAFLIFASGSSWANPHNDTPSTAKVNEDYVAPPDPVKTENLSPSPVQAPKEESIDVMATRWNRMNFYYPYKKELELHAGVVFGLQDSSEDKDLMNALIGFSYLLPHLTSPCWVMGADLSLVGHGHLYVAQRKIYNEKSALRPYYDFGIMHKLVPDEAAASLSNWNNYLLRFGIGVGEILNPPKSLKMDLNIAVGAKDVLVLFTFGKAWGF